MILALIAAGGKGERFSKEGGKQFFKVEGKYVVVHTIERFLRCKDVDFVLPVINKEEREKLASAMKSMDAPKEKLLEPAFSGSERFYSVLNGLEKLKMLFGEEFENSIVLIHDGARPLVSESLIKRAIQCAAEKGAGVPVVRIPDTVKEVDDAGRVKATLNRDRLRLVQTPQAFRAGIVYESYRRAVESCSVLSFTDDAAVVEATGYEVYTFEGERTNIKITYPEDEHFVIFYLKNFEGGG